MWVVTDALARELITPATPKARRRGARATVADAWLRALGSPDGTLEDCEDDEIVQLAGRLAEWHATKSAEAEAVRTCFRIVPPPAEGEEPVHDPTDAASSTWETKGHLA